MKNRRSILAGLIVICAALGLLFLENDSEYTELVFSAESGFYEDSFELELYAPVGTEIYYTLDGSEPDENAMKYTEPIVIKDASANPNIYSLRTDVTAGYMEELIHVCNPDLVPPGYAVPDYPIDKCTVVRAAYRDEDGRFGEVTTKTYFVGYDEKAGYDGMNVISVVTDPDNLFDQDTGIYVLGRIHEEQFDAASTTSHWWKWAANFHQRGREWERAASIQIFDADRTLLVNQECGIRIQGGGSRGFLPRSMSLYAREEYDEDGRFYVDLFGTDYQADTVTLFAGGNDYTAKFRDRLISELVKDRNFATMHYEPYVMFLDGEYWGVYWLTEKYNDAFVGYYYDVEKKNVVMIKNDELAEGEEADYGLYTDMVDHMTSTDFTVPGSYEYACGIIDMQSFIDYYAAEIYIGRYGDWPMTNFALWRTRQTGGEGYEDGKWRWMLFDVNSGTTTAGLTQADTLSLTMDTSNMFYSLCQSGEFRKQFTLTFMDLANTCFAKENVDDTIEKAAAQIAEPMKVNHKRFFGAENEEVYWNTVADIQFFLDNRRPYIVQYLKDDFGLAGSLVPVEVEINDADAGRIIVNTAEISFHDETVWCGEYFTDYPVTLKAVANEGYRFAGWEAGGEAVSEEESIELTLGEEGVSRKAVFEKINS